MKNLSARKIAWGIILLIAIAMILASCSSSKKIKSSEHKIIDSSRSTITNTVAVAKTETNATASKYSTATDSNELLLVFADESDTTEKVNDYAGAAVKPKQYNYVINGQAVSTPVPIKSASIKNQSTNQVKTVAVIQVKNNDSLVQASSETTATHIDDKKSNKQTTRSGPAWGFWIPVILGSVIFIFLGFRFGWFTKIISWFLALFKRRQKTPPAINYSDYSPPAPPGSKT